MKTFFILLSVIMLLSCSKDYGGEGPIFGPVERAFFKFPYPEYTSENTTQLNEKGEEIGKIEIYDSTLVIDFRDVVSEYVFIRFGDIIDTLSYKSTTNYPNNSNFRVLTEISKNDSIIWTFGVLDPVYPQPK